MRRCLLAALAVLAITASCRDGGKPAQPAQPTDSKPPPDGAPTAVKDEPMDWDRAEQIAREHHLAGGGGPSAKLEPIQRVKYLFKVGPWWILVHRGRVLTDQGGAPLAGYLAETALEDRRGYTADDLVTLIRLFGAFPPVTGHDAQRFHLAAEHPALLPRLDREGDRALFRLYYDVTRNAGKSADPDARTIAEWTLAIEADGKSAWTEKARSYHRGKKELAP
jgi:hypothetical protein